MDMVKKTTTIRVDEEKLNAVKALGFTLSGLIDNILDGVLEDRKAEIVSELKEAVKAKIAEAKKPSWKCVCGSSAFEEQAPLGDMRIIKCRRCKKKYLYTDGGWNPLTYVEPEGLEAWNTKSPGT